MLLSGCSGKLTSAFPRAFTVVVVVVVLLLLSMARADFRKPSATGPNISFNPAPNTERGQTRILGRFQIFTVGVKKNQVYGGVKNLRSLPYEEWLILPVPEKV